MVSIPKFDAACTLKGHNPVIFLLRPLCHTGMRIEPRELSKRGRRA
jgi:hypothetical protein